MYEGYLYPYSYTAQPLTNTDSGPRANTQEWAFSKGLKCRSQWYRQLQARPLLLMSTRQHVITVWLSFQQTLTGMQMLGQHHSLLSPEKPGKKKRKKEKTKNKTKKTTCPCRQSISTEISMATHYNGSIYTTISFFFSEWPRAIRLPPLRMCGYKPSPNVRGEADAIKRNWLGHAVAFIIKLNVASTFLHCISEYQFWECQRKFQFQMGAVWIPALRAWPLPFSFSFLPIRLQRFIRTRAEDTLHTHSQMHRAGNKINLVAIVFTPVWWPRVSSSVTAREG